jgi:hypothetical protein
MREGAVEVWKILAELRFCGDLAPGGNREKFVDAFEGEAHFVVAFDEAFPKRFAPIFPGLGHIHLVTADPWDPLGNLGLVAPGHFADRIESIFNVDSEIEGVFTGHVTVVKGENDRYFDGLRVLSLICGRVFRSESVGHVDKIGDFAHGFGYSNVIDVDTHERVGRERWCEDVIGLELADFLPESGQKGSGNGKGAVAGYLTVWQTENTEVVLADLGGSFLFLKPEAHGFFAGAEVMAGFAVGADQDAGVELRAQFSPPELEGARSDEFKIIKMRVDTENPHAKIRSGIDAIPRTENV